MVDQRDPEIRALLVELAMSAQDAPTWESIGQRSSQTQEVDRPVPQRGVPGWAVALAAAVVALVSIGGTLLLLGTQSRVAETPTTPVTTMVPVTTIPATTAPPVTTVAPSATSAVEALVPEYYAAYNTADAERALAFLSPYFREVSAANLVFWTETLKETVSANCTAAPDTEDGILCTETYTDPLHSAAGLSLDTSFVYFERDGMLLQTVAPGGQNSLPGCLEARCPNEYDVFTEDLFAWLRVNYPPVAAQIEDASYLKYFAANEQAVTAALPYAAQFVAQSPDWGSSPVGPAIEGMTALQAVEAHYAAINSHDPEVIEAFFGFPVREAMQWLWALGTKWEASCEAVADDPTLVRCEEIWVDDFYAKAGAQFEYGVLWSVVDGQMGQSHEWELSSSHWAYSTFETGFGYWMLNTHPDDYRLAFAGSRLARIPEAAEITVARIDEFLEQSPDYPRSPDPLNSLRN